jgi:hypothetical protein
MPGFYLYVVPSSLNPSPTSALPPLRLLLITPSLESDPQNLIERMSAKF